MNRQLSSLIVKAETTLQEILDSFESAQSDLILLDERTVLADPHLELLTDYPRSASAALVSVKKQGDTLMRQSRVASASSESHHVTIGNRDFVGALLLSQQQREPILAALREAIPSLAIGNAIDLTLVALVRATVRVDAVDIWGAPFVRSSDPAQRDRVKASITQLNMGRVRLRLANRANDGFFSVFVLRKFSKILTWLAVRIGATPNQVTLFSFAVGLASAYAFAQGTFISLVFGAVALQLSLIIDCVDGELARYTRKFSKLGAWLDAVTDRVKEYLVFLGLAVGAANNGEDLWIPAMAMMAIQTFRHLSDYNFAQSAKIRAEVRFQKPIDFMAEFDGIIPSEREPKGRLRYWLGKMIQFPIGERWLVISASAVIGGPVFTFTIMPILALISGIFVFRGRIFRTREWDRSKLSSNLISNQLDLMGIKESFTKRASWIEPSLLRILEAGIMIAIFANRELLDPTAFLLLFAIIFNHYDNLYRALQGESKPAWLSRAGLFVGGRVLLVGIAVALDWPLILIATYFLTLFLGLSSAQWIIAHRPDQASRGNRV